MTGPESPTSRSALKRWALWSGPAVAALTVLLAALDLQPSAFEPAAFQVLGITYWIAVWWMSEVVPIAATSMLPLVLFPMLRVAPFGDMAGRKGVASAYMDPFVMLLLGGFMAAFAIERWNLHRRMAFRILLGFGNSPRRLVLGMMVATAVCSMWISNTATTLIMLPIGIALVTRLKDELGADSDVAKRFGLVLFLGLAYAASVGGLGTPIGTPPNLIYMQNRGDVSFLDWLMFGLPTVAILIPLIWFYLITVVGKLPRQLPVSGREVLHEELGKLGRMSREEKVVALVFAGMALLWITRKITLGVDPETGEKEIIGWASALGVSAFVHDGVVAVAGALVLFIWPSHNRPGERLLDWPTAKKIPWDVLLLFGGGIALARAFKQSGLSEVLIHQLDALASFPAPLMILCVALTVTFLTEVTSNTATANLMMPLLAAFAVSNGLVPDEVMLPAVLSVSCAFMLPVATAPNAIVYGSGQVPIQAMVRAGFWLNLGCAGVITLLAWLVF